MKQIRRYIILTFVVLAAGFLGLEAKAQQQLKETHENNKTAAFAPAKIIEGDTVIHVNLRRITVMPPYRFKNKRERRRYDRLTRYVIKVYPYAQIIQQKYREINDELKYIPEKDRKKFVKQKEKELRDQFEGELVKLTFMQGRILIKLVDRQTGATTYDVVKHFKGDFNAVLWQSVARVFGSNLKSEYNADGDDKMIEDIIVRIENGTI